MQPSYAAEGVFYCGFDFSLYVIVSVPAYNDTTDVSLKEIKINKRHKWKNKTVSEISLPKNSLVAAIKRGDEFIIPNGESQILENDVLILCE
ncbi:MAG: hypothetical protein LUC92_09980 [Clostridiales bacterium]|nr:hypothetical protein [Clostridiales bacterium]